MVKMKALDIVRTPKGALAVITETINNGQEASIDFIGDTDTEHEHNSWWDADELEVIDSIPRILAMAMAHPFGNGKDDVELFYGEK